MKKKIGLLILLTLTFALAVSLSGCKSAAESTYAGVLTDSSGSQLVIKSDSDVKVFSVTDKTEYSFGKDEQGISLMDSVKTGVSNIINELTVSNVANSIKFYEGNFGFSVEFMDGNPVTWAQIKKDNLIMMLEDYNTVKSEIENYSEKTNSSNLIMFEYSSTEEVDELYSTLKKQKVSFFSDYMKTDYGKVEFGVYDLDKNMILISALVNDD